jgi:tRNA 2-selenouridine synthase
MQAATSLIVPTTDAGALLDGAGRVYIDLRSPSEFAEDHLPGAHSVPLFDDLERALIGTLYARRGPAAAFTEGRARVAARIAELVARVGELAGWRVPEIDLAERVERLTEGGMARFEAELESVPCPVPPEDALVLYCWRGGLRSRSVVALLRELGLERALALEGGYRAYRRQVRARLAAWSAPESFVLRGLTGVGKTLVLRELERIRPGWTLDLEGCAGHRSSILGGVGLEPVSQKRFESRLAERLARGFPGRCVLEGESRKVGDRILPETIWRAVDGGTALELNASLERRVTVLIEDYLAAPENRAGLAHALPFIEERLGRRRWGGVLVGLLASGRERELVRVLLESYYDPLYRHSEGERRYAARFPADDPARAAAEIARWIEARRELPL